VALIHGLHTDNLRGGLFGGNTHEVTT